MMQSELLQEIERAAASGKKPPEGLAPAESMLYYMLLGLFACYRSGSLTAEDGKQQKLRIYNIYNRYVEDYRQFTEICKLYQQRIREGAMI